MVPGTEILDSKVSCHHQGRGMVTSEWAVSWCEGEGLHQPQEHPGDTGLVGWLVWDEGSPFLGPSLEARGIGYSMLKWRAVFCLNLAVRRWGMDMGEGRSEYHSHPEEEKCIFLRFL